MPSPVFISGVSGYLGHALVPLLNRRGFEVRAVVRAGSRVPPGCNALVGDALRTESFAGHVKGCKTLVHLTGARHPAPWKGAEFEAVDRVSLEASLRAAIDGSVRHFVYVSVAHPAPVMKDYIRVRRRCEEAIRRTGIAATILRPWYVLGPGHRWPVMLSPVYWAMERIPFTREGALRLGLVTLDQMALALDRSIAELPLGNRVVDVAGIRRLASTAPGKEMRIESGVC
jgi:uncharacterized protein YbjT (DUF2867 family)